MLNDHNLDAYAEDFGTRIQFEAGLMQWMAGIAINRVRILLSDLVAAEPYREKIEQQRFDFLRTRAAFDFCMDQAYKRWKWTVAKLK
jgi:hypothetical protein